MLNSNFILAWFGAGAVANMLRFVAFLHIDNVPVAMARFIVSLGYFIFLCIFVKRAEDSS